MAILAGNGLSTSTTTPTAKCSAGFRCVDSRECNNDVMDDVRSVNINPEEICEGESRRCCSFPGSAGFVGALKKRLNQKKPKVRFFSSEP